MGYTTGPQPRLGQRGSEPRHGHLRRGHDPAVVARPGTSATHRPVAADHRRHWRKQRIATPLVEMGTATARSGLTISVCHFPPGTSKWNKIEHRLFSFISQNWRGEPLLTHAAIVSLIAATRTQRA